MVKRNALSFLLIILFLSLVKVSWGIASIDIPTALPQHPRIAMTPVEIEEVKFKIRNYSWASWMYDEIKREADNFMAQSVNLPGAGSSGHENIAEKLRFLSMVYILGDVKDLGGGIDYLSYAKRVKEYLLAYAVVYRQYPFNWASGKATGQSLNEAMWVTKLCFAYDLIYSSGVVSYEERQNIEQNVLKAAIDLSIRRSHHHGSGNWQEQHIAAQAIVGFCIGDFAFINEAINGGQDWWGWAKKLAHDYPDGFQWERSIGYHFFPLTGLERLAEVADRNGLNLYNVEIPNERGPGMRSMKDLFDSPMYFCFQNGLVADIGDSGWQYINGRGLLEQWHYEIAYKRYGDERYRWLLNKHFNNRYYWPWIETLIYRNYEEYEEAQWERGDNSFCVTGQNKKGCSLFPNVGFVVLRGDEKDDNSTGIVLNYGPYGSGHSHPEMLSIVAYGQSKLMLPGPGSWNYNDPIHVTWNKQTIAHNTITVDEISQYPQGDSDYIWADGDIEGTLQLFDAGPYLKVARADCDKAYEGVKLDRTIALVDSYMIDIYRVSSEATHKYDLAFHGRGIAESSLPLTSISGTLGTRKGYRHIKNIKRGVVEDRNWEVRWVENHKKLRLISLPGEGQEIILGDAPTRPEFGPMPDHLVAILRRDTNSTCFISVLEPCADSYRIKNVEQVYPDGDFSPDNVSVLKIDLTEGYTDYIISSDRPQDITLTFGDYCVISTNAMVSFARISGIELIASEAYGYGGNIKVAFWPYFTTSLPDIEIDEDNYKVPAFDLWEYTRDPDTAFAELEYRIINSPDEMAGVSISNGHLLSIIPATDWYGEVNVEVQVRDKDNLTDEGAFHIRVRPVNDPPVLHSIGDKEINEMERLEFTISGEDVDNAELFYLANNLPIGANFDSDTRTFIWIPSYEQAGEYSVTFVVSDGKLSDSETITITVINLNRTPVAVVSANPTEGYVPLTVKFKGSDSFDPDGDRVTYLWKFGDGWSSTEPDPIYTYRTAGRYKAALKVTDIYEASSEASINIVVKEANTAPGITYLRNYANYWIMWYGWDKEDRRNLTYSCRIDNGGWSSWSRTRWLYIPRLYLRPGRHTIYVKARDSQGLESQIKSRRFYVRWRKYPWWRR